MLHLVWAAGGLKIGSAVLPERDGTPLLSPGWRASVAVALLLFAAALLVLQRGGVLGGPLPAAIVRAGCWTVALVFTARAVGDFRYLGFFKRVRNTRFAYWDTRLFAPLCLAFAIGTARLALR